MPNYRIEFQKNCFYHIYNRGISKQKIFFDFKDYERFYKYIAKYLEEHSNDVELVSFCIIPNHFHFVIRSLQKGYQVSNFMKKLQGSYGTYLKTKYKDTLKKGQVFEGRFKSKLLDNEEYINQCIAYVNYNPIKHKLVDRIGEYPYTSYYQVYKEIPGFVNLKNIHKEKLPEFQDIQISSQDFF